MSTLTLTGNHFVGNPTDAVSVQADPCRGEGLYNEFYQHGGWRYSFWKEFWWHRRHLVKRFSLRRGMRLLEVACGNGFHTNLLNWMGFDCVGVDRSEAGIAWARNHYPSRPYHRADIMDDMPFPRASFDVVFARGCSHYHYDLKTDQALGTSRRLLQFLKPGGVFVMVIVTDRSGRREPNKVWHNTLDDYRRHFSSLGLKWSVDWADGMAICALFNSPQRTEP
ncbi:MAG: class I SAM-dependent methyltransferase [Planctomycetota bacterium]